MDLITDLIPGLIGFTRHSRMWLTAGWVRSSFSALHLVFLSVAIDARQSSY